MKNILNINVRIKYKVYVRKEKIESKYLNVVLLNYILFLLKIEKNLDNFEFLNVNFSNCIIYESVFFI